MGEERHWHLVCYDIRDDKTLEASVQDPERARRGIQYSIFRVQMTRTQLEELRWELGKVMAEEDDLMIVRLCPGCAQRVIDSRGEHPWKNTPPTFEIL